MANGLSNSHEPRLPATVEVVAVAQVPYFAWVSIATVLQLSITIMNW